MAEIRVNPTRMELKKLKNRLITARRGHKLLKDKRDELMRRFLDVVREDRELRQTVEKGLRAAYAAFSIATGATGPRPLREALILPRAEGELTVGTHNLMSVICPTFSLRLPEDTGGGCYGFAFTSAELDPALEELSALTADLIRLAELEKTASLLALEIERTRRRVNALEYIMIPQYEEAIRRISMKLDENERGSRTRLMKVKDMMLLAAREAAAQRGDL